MAAAEGTGGAEAMAAEGEGGVEDEEGAPVAVVMEGVVAEAARGRRLDGRC